MTDSEEWSGRNLLSSLYCGMMMSKCSEDPMWPRTLCYKRNASLVIHLSLVSAKFKSRIICRLQCLFPDHFSKDCSGDWRFWNQWMGEVGRTCSWGPSYLDPKKLKVVVSGQAQDKGSSFQLKDWMGCWDEERSQGMHSPPPLNPLTHMHSHTHLDIQTLCSLNSTPLRFEWVDRIQF